MSIFSEIRNKITRHVMTWLETPSDHPRLQDDVPDEVILRHLHADYKKYAHERMVLIAYIKNLESIYKEAQTMLYNISVCTSPPTKKKIIQRIRLLAYNLTKEHIAAQQRLRTALGENEQSE